MSAFVVQDKTINRVVSYLGNNTSLNRIVCRELELNPAVHENDREQLGKAMFDLNCNAVEQRYGEGEARSFRDLNYQYDFEITTAIQAYKSLGCWLYQCMEGDVPETSALYKTMERVYDSMAHSIVQDSPAYDKGEWG